MFKKIFILLFLLTILTPLNDQVDAEKAMANNLLTMPTPAPIQQETKDFLVDTKQEPIAEPNLSDNNSTLSPAKEKIRNAFLDFINNEACAAKIDEEEEKKILREKWKQFLGIDIFYPYFKAKEVEKWIRDKASIKIFGMKGRPKFDRNQIIYTFKATF